MYYSFENRLLRRYLNQTYLARKKATFLLRFSVVVLFICVIGLIFHGDYEEVLFYAVSACAFSAIIVSLTRGNLSISVTTTSVMISVSIFIGMFPLDGSYENILETIMECFLSYIVVGLVAVRMYHILYTMVSNTLLTLLHAILLTTYTYHDIALPHTAYRYFIGGIVAVALIGFVILANAKIHDEALNIVERKREHLESNHAQLEHLVDARTQELKLANDRLHEVNVQLRELSARDQLTGILNRGSILEYTRDLLMRHQFSKAPFCVAMLDIDHFKAINDTYGHLAGDFALQSFVNICKRNLLPTGHIGRVGGEEFFIVDEAQVSDVSKMLDKIRSDIEQTEIKMRDIQPFHITISIGLAQFSGYQTLEDLTHQADQALYESKRAGRNRITVYKDDYIPGA